MLEIEGMDNVQTAIHAEGLSKTFKNGVKALNGLSFTVRQGEIFGLLGPNGAGKSTAVRILTTLSQPDSGQALVGGIDVLRNPTGVRRQIGYVAQVSGVDKYGTGRENLTLQAQIQRVAAGEIAGRVSNLLAWAGLAEAADRLVKTYSGGMKRRLDIAMALVHNPVVLFLDEPTTGLDPETRSALWRYLSELRQERNLTILLTTHYLEEADQLCDRLAIINQGRLVVSGIPSDLKTQIQGDMVTLNTNGNTAHVADLLRPVAGVHELLCNGEAVTARVAQGATAVPQLIAVLERAGITVQAVTLNRPSLDDVYLYHTGHRFAVEEPAGVNHSPV